MSAAKGDGVANAGAGGDGGPDLVGSDHDAGEVSRLVEEIAALAADLFLRGLLDGDAANDNQESPSVEVKKP